ncbi:pentapeptide repeat-containing protein [Allokutzneria oryzae]|uniref:Pentapeptide repeat-containing protein n=1 Tax=Allokutzneria oryzae TaxID=1378989 RepID=A0ABV6A8Z7_9PSEU
MSKGRGDDRPVYRVLGYSTVAVVAVLVVAGGVGLAAWLLLTYGSGNEVDRGRLDAIKTAGAIVLGSGGLVALWLAVRRQRTTEIALKQKDREHDHAERDAAERRTTELYTKAADQLGSDKAPVRLAGMYALERLAQSNPAQRQTVVNVLCAYLRMPYTPTVLTLASAHDPTLSVATEQTTPVGEQPAPEDTTAQRQEVERYEQERQVRLTAQRILTAHLRPGDNPSLPVETFWEKIDLDLTGATLLELDFSQCYIHAAEFGGAQFSGDAWFHRARFGGDVKFGGAHFSSEAQFSSTKFNGSAMFGGAQFGRDVWFGYAQFSESAWFSGAQFNGDAWFSQVQFNGDAWFGGGQFNEDALFSDAQFSGGARFGGAQFNGNALFDGVKFNKSAWLRRAQFNERAEFDEVRVRLDLLAEVMRTWPDNYIVTEPASEADGHLPGHDGRWGHLVHANTNNLPQHHAT